MRYEKKNEILERGMTVAELIEALQEQSPTSRVVFASDYGDISHTMQALVVSHVDAVDYGDISESAYSQSGLSVSDDSDSDETGGEEVVVLNLK